LTDVSKNNLMLTDVDGIFSDVTYKIKRDKNNKTKMKLNYFSSIPVRLDFIPPSNVHVVHYGQPRPVIVQQVGGVSQTTTTTTIQNGGTNVGVGVNIGGVNMGISINDSMGNGLLHKLQLLLQLLLIRAERLHNTTNQFEAVEEELVWLRIILVQL
jgi:hypothetical protein